MQMDDNTFNFMMWLKFYRPKAHDAFVSMVHMSVINGRSHLRRIFDEQQKVTGAKFNWELNDINLFAIRQDLLNGAWVSRTWDILQGKERKGDFYEKTKH